MANPHDPDAISRGTRRSRLQGRFHRKLRQGQRHPHPKIVTQVSVHPPTLRTNHHFSTPLKSPRTKGSSPKLCSPTTNNPATGSSRAAWNTEWSLCAALGEPCWWIRSHGLCSHRKNTIISCPWGNNALNIVHSGRKKTVSISDPARCRECPHSRVLSGKDHQAQSQARVGLEKAPWSQTADVCRGHGNRALPTTGRRRVRLQRSPKRKLGLNPTAQTWQKATLSFS